MAVQSPRWCIVAESWWILGRGELLTHHGKFRSNHILSRIAAIPGTPPSAELTCTGSLWAVSKETGQQVNIDSWYGEVHYMVKE
ncbi:MAG: hypothetical protein KGS09_21250 [Nitrospirae bacterium]|nr:hypothetical protein [Nitrospirota bacterium]MDE3218113.1 hypothetical protein [Nitrospirota bacterium]